MLRGDIRLVDWAPARGSEAEKRRPAVVLSNDAANAAVARLAGGVVTVVPVSRKVTRIFPFQVFLPAATRDLPSIPKLRHSRSGQSPPSGWAGSLADYRRLNWPSSTMHCDFTCSCECLVDMYSNESASDQQPTLC
jgi:mRNA-degrading endonuclease toxin of MazEF toxin-antitoxin module